MTFQLFAVTSIFVAAASGVAHNFRESHVHNDIALLRLHEVYGQQHSAHSKRQVEDPEEQTKEFEKETHEVEEHEAKEGVAGIHEENEHTGKIVALFLITLIGQISILFGMTHASEERFPHVANFTIVTLDLVVGIFLAVLWFQGFDQLLDGLLHNHMHVLVSTIHSLLLFVSALCICWSLRTKGTSMVVFTSIACHYCGFAASHTAIKAQSHFFADGPVICFVGFFALVAAIIALGIGLDSVKYRLLGVNSPLITDESTTKDEESKTKAEFLERWDDVETDFAAMALAVYWNLLVRFVVVGEYEEEEEVEPGETPLHDIWSRSTFLLYCISWTILAAFVASKLKGEDGSYFGKRIKMLVRSFFSMSIAYAFLFWGAMYYYHHPDRNTLPIFHRLIFASIVSAWCMLIIFVLAAFEASSAVAKLSHLAVASRKIELDALGLIAGFAWEQTFDEAVEGATEDTPHEHTAKALLAIFAGAMVLPVYLVYVKPIVLKISEAED